MWYRVVGTEAANNVKTDSLFAFRKQQWPHLPILRARMGNLTQSVPTASRSSVGQEGEGRTPFWESAKSTSIAQKCIKRRKRNVFVIRVVVGRGSELPEPNKNPVCASRFDPGGLSTKYISFSAKC